MTFHDLRAFLSHLERGGQLARIAEPVDPDLETRNALARVVAGTRSRP